MAGYGYAQGLSYRNDWDKDIDRLYQRAEYAAQVQAEKERKTLFYAELLKKGQASSPRAVKELESFYTGLNSKLADFVTENPNFESDPGLMQQFLGLSDQYLNNDVLRKDLQVQQEFEKLRQAKSSGDLLPEEALEQTEKYYNYINSEPGSDIEPYVFTKLKKFEFNDIVKDTNDRLKGTVVSYTSKDKQQIRRSTKTSESDLRFAAATDLQDPNKRLAIEKQYNNLNPELKSQVGYRDIEEWYAGVLKVGEEFGDEFQTWNAAYTKSLESGGSGSDVPFVYHNVLNPISKMMDAKDAEGRYIDSEMTSTSSDKILTFMGTENYGSVNGSSGVRVNVGNNLVPFDLGRDVKLKFVNTNKIAVKGRNPYIAMTVSFDVPLDRNDKPVFDVPSSWGFQVSKTENPAGWMASAGMTNSSGSFTPGQTYTGVIYAPVIADPTRVVEWDKSFLGVSHAGNIAVNSVNELASRVNTDPNMQRIYNQQQMEAPTGPSSVDEIKKLNNEAGYELWKYGRNSKTGKVGYFNKETNQFIETAK